MGARPIDTADEGQNRRGAGCTLRHDLDVHGRPHSSTVRPLGVSLKSPSSIVSQPFARKRARMPTGMLLSTPPRRTLCRRSISWGVAAEGEWRNVSGVVFMPYKWLLVAGVLPARPESSPPQGTK